MSAPKLIGVIEKEKPILKFSVLYAMKIPDVGWGKAKTETIANCFAEVSISKKKLMLS